MLGGLTVLSIGLLVAPPQLQITQQPASLLVHSHEQTAMLRSSVVTAEALFPSHCTITSADAAPAECMTTQLLADGATGAYIQEDFDAAFLVVVPFLLGGMLYLFFKLFKLFASAF